MNQYLIELEHHDEKVVCIPRESGTAGLGLNENGITWGDPKAPIRLEMNDNEMKIVKGETNADAMLERNGRKHILKPGKSVRLLANDRIFLGSLAVRVSNLFKSSSNGIRENIHSMKSMSKVAMLVLASSLAVVMPSCESQDAEPTQCSSITDLNKRKACCEALTNDADKTECCDELAKANSEFACESTPNISENIDGEMEYRPQEECYAESDLSKRKACCEAISDEKSQKECCDELAKANSDFVCESPTDIPEVLAGETLPDDATMCSFESDLSKRKACCEAISDEAVKTECCDELAKANSKFVCEKAPEIEEPTAGVIAFIPCDGETGNDLKLCCETLTEESEKTECCNRLVAENSDFKCE